MNNPQTAQLARWIAERLGDGVAEVDGCTIVEGKACSEPGLSFSAYTSSMNTARRLLGWVVEYQESISLGNNPQFEVLDEAITNFFTASYSDTPAAMLALCQACGFELEGE